MTQQVQLVREQERILSVDFFRGLTMFLLIGEFSELFTSLVDPAFNGTIVAVIGNQLQHHEWNGLHFWDLIQPFFMFIVGVAMPFSFNRRWDKGDSWNTTFYHALKRSLLLLFIGWALYCIGPGKITFHFANVLAQLSVTYMVAFLLMRKAVKWQLIISFGLLLVTDLLYRFWSVDGFNQPFTPDHNFGSWFDMAVQGSLNGDHWASFNAIPTSAHTIWGVLAGMLLMNGWTPRKKILVLLGFGLAGVIIGYSMNPYVPIIKRICTSSFVIVSGGWALIGLGISYWLIDVLNFKKSLLFFAVVGMNPLFIYLFAHLGGNNLLHDIFIPFTKGIFGWSGELSVNIITSTAVWFSLWYICYILYKRKIFIKL
jgi:predicted acyltransferase